jgi:predicted PurR-regulated permease PerM
LLLKIVSVFGVVQLTDNIIIQPLIFSKSVKAHPLEIFLIVFVGASLTGGPVGMILAIPAYTLVKVSFSEFYNGYKKYQVFKN